MKKLIYTLLAIVVLVLAVRFIIGPPKQIRVVLDEVFGTSFSKHNQDEVDVSPDWKRGKTIAGHYNTRDSTFIPDDSLRLSNSEKFEGEYSYIHTVGGAENFGLIDKTGKIILEPIYAGISLPVVSGMVKVNDQKQKYGWVNLEGKQICDQKYDDLWSFSEGISKVELNNKFGYIDTNGDEITPVKYLEAMDFKDGVAAVCLEPQKWGCIDKTGKIVVPLLYSSDPVFVNGVANVQIDGKDYKIDRQGNRLR